MHVCRLDHSPMPRSFAAGSRSQWSSLPNGFAYFRWSTISAASWRAGFDWTKRPVESTIQCVKNELRRTIPLWGLWNQDCCQESHYLERPSCSETNSPSKRPSRCECALVRLNTRPPPQWS